MGRRGLPHSLKAPEIRAENPLVSHNNWFNNQRACSFSRSILFWEHGNPVVVNQFKRQMTTASDSKRLTKNTILLYARTLVVMLISLYTSRVVLNALGVDDYGINNVVGGFVSLFSIISGTLVATTQRYLNFELGKNSDSNPKKVFGASMCIHIVLALFLLVVLESVGLWFLNNKLNIPPDRLYAANWVFQFSILSFLVSILSTPYTAVIIAHEKMSAFAYISLMDVCLKLGIAYLITVTSKDRLIVYSSLILGVALIDQFVYWLYAKRHFIEAQFSLVKDKRLYKEMFGFAGMNFIGAFASILANQGMDIVLNLFFGVVINAARGISNQILSAVTRFVNDFMTALNPQITKEYASGDHEKSRLLCLRGSKFSFFLMMIFSVPIFFKIPYILEIWLGNYPDYSILFVRCALILSLTTLLSNSLITEILATGNLTSTTYWIGGIRLMALPLAYIVFRLGGGPEYGYYTLFFIEVISLFVRLRILEVITKMTFIRDFIKRVGILILPIVISVGIINFFLASFFSDTLPGLLIYASISCLLTVMFVAIGGLDKNERTAILGFIKAKISKAA